MLMWATPRQSGANGLIHHVFHVIRPHDSFVVFADIHEHLVEIDVLLGPGADQVVEGVASDGQDGLAVVLGVVQAVEQVDAAGARGGHAHAQRAGVFGVATGREGRRLLVPHLHEADLVLILPQRLEEAVDPTAGEAEDHLHVPVEETLDQQVGYRLCHDNHSLS
jgi:hypothetical protein